MLSVCAPVLAEDNYAVFEDKSLVEGDNTCALSDAYDYTMLLFAPTREGVYTFSCDDAKIAIGSNNGMWATIEPSAETVNANSFEWTCSGVGQSIWVAVEGGKSEVVINIAWEEYVVVTIPRTEYENKATLEKFDFVYDESTLVKVDTRDDVESTAVLADDGFYHLDSADGPILYANLDDAGMSLVDINGVGQLVAVRYEDGEVVSKTDYTAAFTAYQEAADSDTMLYPLTEDLITIFQTMGESNKWYGADGWVGGELGDAWMYACYWKPEYNGLGDVNNDEAIDQYDYILVKRHYFETRLLTDDEASRADVNLDEVVDQFDYVLIMRHYFGTYVIG